MKTDEDGVEVTLLGQCFFPDLFQQNNSWRESTEAVRIRLFFDDAQHVSFARNHDDRDNALRPPVFDISQLPDQQFFEQNPGQYLALCEAYWVREGNCPSAGFYRFQDEKGKTHYALNARYYAVIIQANSYRQVSIERTHL